MQNQIEQLMEAIEESSQEDAMIENLCNIVGILMMRLDTKELRCTTEELRALGLMYDGRGIEFSMEEGTMIVKIGASDGGEDAHMLN